MRICIDTQSAQGPKTGIGRYAAGLFAALQKVAPENDYLGLHLGRDVKMRTYRRLLWQQCEVVQRAKRKKADLLHVTGFDAPLWRPCPVVLTVHDLVGRLFPKNLPPISRVYWAFWLPFSVRFASHIITVSEHTRLDLTRLLRIPESRLTLIPHGISTRFRPAVIDSSFNTLKEKYRLPGKYILFVSTLEPRKGLDVLVKSFFQLRSSFPGIKLVIAGKPGWYMKRLLSGAEAHRMEKDIVFTGHVEDKDLPALYSAAELFVFPSRYEGFGFPVLEAMACGTPVVCTNSASLPEVTGDAACLVPAEDSETLTQAMGEVLADTRLRQKMKNRGLEQAAQFTWEEAARQTVRVYKTVLEKKNAHRN